MDVAWLASDATDPAVGRGVRAVPVKSWNVTERGFGVPWPLLGPSAVARIWREAKGADAVLLHDALYMTSIVAAASARAHRKPFVVVQHIGFVPYRNPLLKALMAIGNACVARPILAGASQVAFISQFVRDYFASVRFRRPPLLIFNGVDARVFRMAQTSERDAGRAAFGFVRDERVALFVGRFVEKKGVELLRHVAHLRPQVTFAFAGWGVIDPAAWGLPNVRVFSGLAGERLAALYHASDAFVLPSRGEGFPLVVQEALACGLPVVCGAETTTADPCAAEHLRGVDVSGDPEAAARLVAAALDAALADTAPGAGRAAFAKARYSWAAAADRYAAVLEECAA
jgi:glycosyltransferase involved in cell wall biosynthesis